MRPALPSARTLNPMMMAFDAEASMTSVSVMVPTALRMAEENLHLPPRVSRFVLTMAPQTLDVQTGGRYMPLINNTKDIITIVHTQYYNSGAMQSFRTRLFTRIVPILKEIGLFGPKFQKALGDMGVMEYAKIDVDQLIGRPGLLEMISEIAAEIGLDQRSSERPQIVTAGQRAAWVTEPMGFGWHRICFREPQEELVDAAERQAGGGVQMIVNRGRETNITPSQDIGRNGDNHGCRLDNAPLAMDPHAAAPVINRFHRHIQR